MGGSSYSADDYAVRSSLRSSAAAKKGIDVASATFAHDYGIKTGAVAAAVHSSLKPSGAIRESRDSDAHPISIPIIVITDTTGSMQTVPVMLQKRLTRLMGAFLEDKASGKKYLGEGYPAILIGAVDDFRAMSYGHRGGDGTLQTGQFESGLEIDDNLTNLWLTGNGGGGDPQESYDLALYFAARHTAHDHMAKRRKKGYLFIIGDEKAYDPIQPEQVLNIFGTKIEAPIPLKQIILEARKLYHVFFIIPNMTSHYGEAGIRDFWQERIDAQHFIELAEPEKICECIVGAVAMCESGVSVDELSTDLGFDAKALVPFANSGGAVAQVSADHLPAVSGSSGGSHRL